MWLIVEQQKLLCELRASHDTGETDFQPAFNVAATYQDGCC